MNKNKLWAIAGASSGLGPATIKYLLSRQQTVIALTCDGQAQKKLREMPSENLEIAAISLAEKRDSCNCLRELTDRYGPIHTLIDNYRSIPMVELILPYLDKQEGRIVLAPPPSGEKEKTPEPDGSYFERFSTYLCSY
jgi:NAD(P)-dependent dehydrogenase (short-subunit alcohol dehydrogenase family)